MISSDYNYFHIPAPEIETQRGWQIKPYTFRRHPGLSIFLTPFMHFRVQIESKTYYWQQYVFNKRLKN